VTSATQDEDSKDADDGTEEAQSAQEPTDEVSDTSAAGDADAGDAAAGDADAGDADAGDADAGDAGAGDAGAGEDKSTTGGITTRYAGRTTVGLVREHNEDNFVIVDLTKKERSPRDEVTECVIGERGMLFSVCDGMGGAAAGEVASQMAVDIMFEALTRGDAPKDRDDLARRLVSAVEEAGKKIYDGAQSERERRGMGTTTTSVALMDKVLFAGEVGDSRAYLLRKGTMRQITKDQSLVSQLIEAGHLTEDEAEAFEHSNIILQALGTNESVDVDLTFVELRKGDRLMVCSDGLSGLVHDDSICEAMGDIDDPVECASTLIEYAEAGGGHDNITVIIADFDGDGLDEPGEDDAFGYMQYPLIPADADGEAESRETEKPGPMQAAAPDGETAGTGARRDDGSSGSMAWVVAGIVALAIGAYVLNLSAGDEPESTLQPSPEAPVEAAPPEVEEIPAVEVRIHTDVEAATLLVNGEAHGSLPTDGPREMKLRPGAYRFEAQSGGGSSAVAVVTVRPEIPLDVYLSLPKGRDGSGGEAAVEAPEAAAEAGDDPGAAAPKPAPAPTPAAAPKSQKAADPAAEERRRQRREERAAKRAEAKAKAAARPKPKPKPKAAPPPPPAKPKPAPPPPQEGIPDNPF